MRYYEAVAILLLLVASFILGVYSGANHVSTYPVLASIMVVFFIIYSLPWMTGFLERSALSYATRKVLFMGRGVPTSLIRTQIILVESSILGLLLGIGYLVALGPRARSSITIPVILFSFIIIIIFSLVIVRLRGSLTISSRKTSVEVEFPFLLALMRALSETHLSLYDLLNIISESQALRAWSREVILAKRLSGTMGMSLLQTMSIIADTHPSKLVRDTFKRIVVVGNLAGTIRDVVSRTFSYVYGKLDMRLNALIDRLDLINGALMFGFMFIPILMATVAPLSHMTPVGVAGIVLMIEVPMVLLTYAILTAMYPSGFAAKPSTGINVLAILSITLVVAVTGVYLAPVIKYSLQPHTPSEYLLNPPSLGMSVEIYTLIVTLLLLPPTIVGEVLHRKLVLYSDLIKLTTDTAEVSASLGENFITLFTRESHRYGQKLRRLVKSIVESYQTPLFRKAVVARAPTLFHATFLETLLYALMIGAPATVLKGLTESYESLMRVWDKTRGVTRTLEGMIISLSGMMGFFIEYLYKMFYGFAQSIQQATQSGGSMMIGGAMTLLTINPSVFISLSALTSISVIIVSLFTGKTRGGSLIFGFRTALISFLLYQILEILVLHLVHGPSSLIAQH